MGTLITAFIIFAALLLAKLAIAVCYSRDAIKEFRAGNKVGGWISVVFMLLWIGCFGFGLSSFNNFREVVDARFASVVEVQK